MAVLTVAGASALSFVFNVIALNAGMAPQNCSLLAKPTMPLLIWGFGV